MVSNKQSRSSCAWIVGILVFILAMTITFSDVYGLNHFDFPSTGNTPGSNGSAFINVTLDEWQSTTITAHGDYYDPTLPTSSVPPSIPEPTTLALLAIGCGVLLAGKRKLNL